MWLRMTKYYWNSSLLPTGGGSSVYSGLGTRALGSSPDADKIGKEGAQSQYLENHQGTLEQCNEPPNTDIGPCNKLGTHSGLLGAVGMGSSTFLLTTKWIKELKRKRESYSIQYIHPKVAKVCLQVEALKRKQSRKKKSFTFQKTQQPLVFQSSLTFKIWRFHWSRKIKMMWYQQNMIRYQWSLCISLTSTKYRRKTLVISEWYIQSSSLQSCFIQDTKTISSYSSRNEGKSLSPRLSK